MKTKSISIGFTLASILLLSCSGSIQFGADEEKVKNTFLKVREFKPELCEFFEIKLVRNVTAEDSLYYNLNMPSFIEELIADYNRTLANLKNRIAKRNDPSQQYKEFQEGWLEDDIEEVNRFANAFDGKFDDKEWKYKRLYRDVYRLKNLPPDKVLGKIYSITYKHRDIEKSTVLYVYHPNLEKTNGGTIDLERTEPAPKFDLEMIHFKPYVQD